MTETFSAEVDQAQFTRAVLDRSKTLPVVVDFWAAWCAPCRMLMPVLAKLAEEYQGKFFLAKVNTDQEQALATRYGIRSLPTVKIFRHGEVVDEFMGVQPESAIRQILDRHIPRPSDALLDAARAQRAAGRPDEALATLQRAADLDPEREPIRLERVGVLLDLGRFDDAESLLQSFPINTRHDAEIAVLKARAELLRIAADSPPEPMLRASLDSNPRDSEARYRLGVQLALREDYAGALDQLLEVVRHDRKFCDDAARKSMLSIFTLLGGQGALVNHYRRQLSLVLL